METTGRSFSGTAGELRDLDARRQLDVRQVQDLVQLEIDDVELQELRQVLRQAVDLHLGHEVRIPRRRLP